MTTTSSTSTPNFGVTLVATNAVQKEVVINEAFIIYDALIARNAKDIVNAPPANPNNGDVYIIGTAPTGVFASYPNQVAFYYSGWRIVQTPDKLQFYVLSQASYYEYSGGAWAAIPPVTVAVLNDLTNVNTGDPSDGEVLTYQAASKKWVATALTLVTTMGALTDVNVTGVTNGQALAWNAAQGKWLPQTFATQNGVTTLAALSDVDESSLSNGSVLFWNAQANKAKFGPITFPTLELESLSDVSISNPQAGYVLSYTNAGQWVAAAAAGLTLDTSATLSSNSDLQAPSVNAVKSYISSQLSSVLQFQGTIDCSGNPNYPNATAGFAWVVSAAGLIGGAAGQAVAVGDVIVCTTTNAGGTQAAVGSDWDILVSKLNGAALAGDVGSSGLTTGTMTILGRYGAGTGQVQELTLGSGLSLVGGVLSVTGGGGGSALTVTDGTNTVADVETLTIVGGTVSSTAAGKATVTLSGGGGGGDAGGGSSATIVQQSPGVRVLGGGGTVTLPNPATEGNLLLLVHSGFAGASIGYPSGFSNPAAGFNYNQGIWFYTMIASGGEQNFAVSNSDNGQWICYEIAGANNFGQFFSSGTTLGGDFNTLFGAGSNGITFFGIEHDDTGLWTVTSTSSNVTVDFNPAVNDGGNHMGLFGHATPGLTTVIGNADGSSTLTAAFWVGA